MAVATSESRGAVLLAWALVGCGAPEAECVEACARPYAIVLAEAARLEAAWRALPEPLAAGLPSELGAWRDEVATAREAYVTGCVPACRAAGNEAAVKAARECRRTAGNLGEWKRCAER